MRQAGWYWVKQVDHPNPGYWEAAFWAGSFWEFHEQYPVVGPRIPTPDEPWQCVPSEPTPEMIDHGAQAIVSWDEGCTWPDSWGADAARHRHDCCKAYRAMLAAAPKPEE